MGIMFWMTCAFFLMLFFLLRKISPYILKYIRDYSDKIAKTIKDSKRSLEDIRISLKQNKLSLKNLDTVLEQELNAYINKCNYEYERQSVLFANILKKDKTDLLNYLKNKEQLLILFHQWKLLDNVGLILEQDVLNNSDTKVHSNLIDTALSQIESSLSIKKSKNL